MQTMMLWIDGIRLRSGHSYNPSYFLWESMDNQFMSLNDYFNHHKSRQSYPVAIELRETVMTFWAFLRWSFIVGGRK